jgi:hypothetical protein
LVIEITGVLLGCLVIYITTVILDMGLIGIGIGLFGLFSIQLFLNIVNYYCGYGMKELNKKLIQNCEY